MKVFWTDKATSHLLSIYEYIQQDSPIYAEKLLDKLISRSEQIASFSYSGIKVPEYDAEHIREIFEGKYRIRLTTLKIVQKNKRRANITLPCRGATSLSLRKERDVLAKPKQGEVKA